MSDFLTHRNGQRIFEGIMKRRAKSEMRMFFCKKTPYPSE